MPIYKNLGRILSINKQLLTPLYEAVNYEPEQKDLDRITSMLSKSDDPAKLQVLAAKMVKSIKHLDKMIRRYKAAAEITGPESVITQEFAKGFAALSNGEPDPVLGNSAPINKTATSTPTEQSVKPVEPEDITDFNTTIQDEIVNVSSDKQEITIKTDDCDEIIKFADGEHEDQLNISPASIKLYQRVIRYFTKKLMEYDVERKFEEAAQNFKNTSKRYKIKSLGIDNIDFMGNITVSGEMQTREQIRSKGGWKSSYYMDTVTWRFSDMRYQFFTGKWDLRNANYHETSLGYDETLASSKSQNKEKCLPMLGAFQKQLEKVIEKDRQLKTLLLQFGNIVTHYFSADFDAITFAQSFLTIKGGYSYNSKFNKMIEYIYEQIEEKFDYSDEPDHIQHPLKEQWNGYKIGGIDDEYVYFTTREAYYYNKHDLNQIVNMLRDIGVSNASASYMAKNRLTQYVKVPIDELIEIIK